MAGDDLDRARRDEADRLDAWRDLMRRCHDAARAHGVLRVDADMCTVEAPLGCPGCPMGPEMERLAEMMEGIADGRHRSAWRWKRGGM